MSDIALDIQLRRGEFQLHVEAVVPGDRVTGIYGPSGSGKTSLLYAIAGLLRPAPESTLRLGADVLQDRDTWVPPHKRDTACVFQDGRLFPHLTVAGNLDYAWRRRRREGPSQSDVTTWLRLSDLLERRPQDLSRGQQQRVAIARALLSAPRLLLLDEPLANIDPAGRRDILARIAELRDRVDIAMIYVSHDMAELAELADQLLVLADGRVSAQGPLLDMSSRIELALAHEEQAAAIVSARIVHHDHDYGLTQLELEGQPMFVASLRGEPGTNVRLRLPARDISLCRVKPEQTSILNVLPARIAEIEGDGQSRVLVRLSIGEQFLLSRVTRKSLDSLALAVGDPVYAQVKSAALLSDTRTVDE